MPEYSSARTLGASDLPDLPDFEPLPSAFSLLSPSSSGEAGDSNGLFFSIQVARGRQKFRRKSLRPVEGGGLERTASFMQRSGSESESESASGSEPDPELGSLQTDSRCYVALRAKQSASKTQTKGVIKRANSLKNRSSVGKSHVWVNSEEALDQGSELLAWFVLSNRSYYEKKTRSWIIINTRDSLSIQLDMLRKACGFLLRQHLVSVRQCADLESALKNLGFGDQKRACRPASPSGIMGMGSP